MTVAPVAPLAVRGLTVRFGSVTAVDGLDLTVDPGVVVGLVGPNGSGKTSTLRAVMGLADAASGDVLIDGVRAGTLTARARAAWVPDEPSGLDELCVDELFALVGALYGADDRFDLRSRTLLEVFGLETRRASALAALSHGMRRIVTFIAAAALDRPLLVVDEATAALDPEAVVVLRETMRALARRGAGVLVATQDLHFAEQTCDSVALLSGGRLVEAGAVDALRARHSAPSLEAVFLSALGQRALLREIRCALDAL